MKIHLNESLYDILLRQRDSLIQQYRKGDLNKRDYLIKNFEFIQGLNREPFLKLDCFEKCFFNYQYYNTLAKFYSMEAKIYKDNTKNIEIYNDYIKKSEHYYFKKDNTIIKTLEVIDYKNIDAYFIKVNSKYLKNKLIEIVFKDYSNIIFHTKSSYIVQLLTDENILKANIKKSIIDFYINQKY